MDTNSHYQKLIDSPCTWFNVRRASRAVTQFFDHALQSSGLKVSQGNIVQFAFTLNRTDTLTATSFEGILPYFFCQEGGTAKALFESAITMHLHPALDHAQIVLRDESAQEGLDYSGVTNQGNSRSHVPLGS